VFDCDAARSEGFVLLPLTRCERIVFAPLVRRVAVAVNFVHALIAGVGQKFHFGPHTHTAAFEERQVVHFTRTCSHAENLLEPQVNDSLPFLGVALLLARVELALFF